MITMGPRASRDLTDYHAVIAADIKAFTGNSDTDNRFLARSLPEVLREAFVRSDLDFSRVKFPGQAGDGYAAGIDYHKLPHLIHPLLDCLQDVLAELEPEFRAQDRGLRMRLRASIHIGPLPGDDDPAGPGGIGKAMNDLHRLLDADPVRDALQQTDPDTTFVAAVISQRAYEDAIQTGACALPPSRLIPIHAQVKQFTSAAWLYVPMPSGHALQRAFADDSNNSTASPTTVAASQAVAPQRAPAATLNSIGHISDGQVIQGTITGDITYGANP
jgi:hypothetical protein